MSVGFYFTFALVLGLVAGFYKRAQEARDKARKQRARDMRRNARDTKRAPVQKVAAP